MLRAYVHPLQHFDVTTELAQPTSLHAPSLIRRVQSPAPAPALLPYQSPNRRIHHSASRPRASLHKAHRSHVPAWSKVQARVFVQGCWGWRCAWSERSGRHAGGPVWRRDCVWNEWMEHWQGLFGFLITLMARLSGCVLYVLVMQWAVVPRFTALYRLTRRR